MKFTNDISFNGKLIEDKIAKINYNGFLAKNGANSISIIYGFGANWDNTDAKEMQKVQGGFEAEIKIQSSDTFNFCFRDENYNWDNNSNCNYISPIEKESENFTNEDLTKETLANETSTKENLTSSQAEVKNIEKEISALFDTLFSEATSKVNTIADEKQNFITPSFIPYEETEITNSKEFNLDDLIEEILNPVVSDSDSLISSLAPQFTGEKQEEKISEVTELHEQEHSSLLKDILEPLYTKPLDIISDSDVSNINKIDNLIDNLVSENVNTVENIETTPIQKIEIIEDIDQLFEDATPVEVISEQDKKVVQKIQEPEKVVSAKKISDFTVIDDDETDKEIKFDEPSLLEEVINEKTNSKVEENVSLSVVEKESGLIVSPRKLGKLYFVKKKIKLALYKALVTIPKILSKQFNSSSDNN